MWAKKSTEKPSQKIKKKEKKNMYTVKKIQLK